MNRNKPIAEAGDGDRIIIHYEGNKFYFVITDQSFDIVGTSDKIKERTQVGFGIINTLATKLIQKGTSLEDLCSLIWCECRNETDLAGLITKALERAMKKNGTKKI